MPNLVAQTLRLARDVNHSKHCIHDVVGSRDLIIYGAGSGYITLSEFVLRKYRYAPCLILDQKFSEETVFDGFRANNPDNVLQGEFSNVNAIFVIAIGDENIYHDVRRMLMAKGALNVIWALELYEYHLSHAHPTFSPDELVDDEDRINRCFEYLEDDLSRQIFLKILETHVRKIPVPIPSAPLHDQYFPNDLTLSKGYARLVNCGSYDGDTVRQLRARYGKVEALACFEPDPNNFAALTQYLCDHTAETADTVIAFPCGLYSDERILRFSAGNKTNSSLSEHGHIHIQCVSLDHVLPQFRPTMINMDIEGSEPEALSGAACTISTYSPDLAICVYHKPNHIYNIPILVKEICNDYRIYLRNYTSYAAETVMYATI